MRCGLLTVGILCLAWAGVARPWGAAGHETVGAIADHLLAGTPAAVRVQAILGMNLRTASVWADCVKGVSADAGQFHYTVSARYRECRPFEDAAGQSRMVDYAARNWDACHPAAGEEPCHKQYHYTDVAIERGRYARRDAGTSDHDIVAAIGAALRVLQGRSAPAPFHLADQREALLLLAHLVGDVHQPLHVGAIYLDPAGREVDPDRGRFDPDTRTRGANQLLDGGRPLHTEWDDVPSELDASHLGITGEREARGVPVTVGPPSGWAVQWASDTLQASHAVFRGVVFGEENVARHTWPATMPTDYTERREALQRRQLVVAGARLAQLLEQVFP
jgi:hypothetical protein